MPPGKTKRPSMKTAAKAAAAASKLAKSSKKDKKDKDKKKEKKKVEDEEDEEEEEEEEEDEDNELEELLEEEAGKLEKQLHDAGKMMVEKKKSKAQIKKEQAELSKAEMKARQAEQGAKQNMFAVDGKVKDKRDMMGKNDEENLFSFESSGTSSSEYKKEGNVEFYTQANLHKRKAIFCDKVVQKWIEVFYNTFASVAKTGLVGQAEFISVQMNIAKALFDPEEWDEREVREVVEADWVRENGMSEGMNKEKYQKSLFELVDTWAASIKLVEYRIFLQKLYFRITMNAGAGNNKEKYQKRLRELDKQRKALNKNKQKLVGRINDLTSQAKGIAEEAKKVREEKLKAEKEALELQLEEQRAKQKMSVIADIMNEPDKAARAKKLKKAKKLLDGIELEDMEKFEKQANALLEVENEKLRKVEEEKQRQAEVARKLKEAEDGFLKKQKVCAQARPRHDAPLFARAFTRDDAPLLSRAGNSRGPTEHAGHDGGDQERDGGRAERGERSEGQPRVGGARARLAEP